MPGITHSKVLGEALTIAEQINYQQVFPVVPLPVFTVQPAVNNDPSVVQMLFREGQAIGVQINLLKDFIGHYIDLGTVLDPSTLGMEGLKKIQVAFGEMEGMDCDLTSVIGNRILSVGKAFTDKIAAGSVLWLLAETISRGQLPATPPVIPTAIIDAANRLLSSDSNEYQKGELGMARFIERTPVYNGPGDQSEIPTPMKTADKVPTAYGWKWPKGSRMFFDESDGTEYILLEDIDGNFDRMDTPQGTRTMYQKQRIVMIVPQAGVEIEIMAPYIHTSSYKDTQMDIGRDLRINVEQDATIIVKRDAKIDVKGKCDITVGKKTTGNFKDDVEITVGKNLNASVKGNCKIDVKGSLEAKGKTIKAEATGQFTIKGKQVMIN